MENGFATRLQLLYNNLINELKLDLRERFDKYIKIYTYIDPYHNYAYLIDLEKTVSPPFSLPNRSFDYSAVTQFFWWNIYGFESTKKIYALFREHKINIFKDDVFDLKNRRTPDTIAFSLISGFLTRNIELNNGIFIIDKKSFEQAFTELTTFIKNPICEYTTITAIYGMEGDFESLNLFENVNIIRVNEGILSGFKKYYPIKDSFYSEVNTNGYVLSSTYTYSIGTPSNEMRETENKTKNTCEKILLLLSIGNIGLGKSFKISRTWCVDQIPAYDYTYNYYNKYFLSKPLVGYRLIKDKITTDKIETLKLYDLENLSFKLAKSTRHLQRAKWCDDIEDRIVDLALALEYLFDTSNYEVTLQLGLKIIKLLYRQNTDTEIFKKIKEFYNYRSKIVHGNGLSTKIKDEKNKIEILNLSTYIEQMLIDAIIRIVALEKRFKYEDIQTALTLSLHIDKDIESILNEIA